MAKVLSGPIVLPVRTPPSIVYVQEIVEELRSPGKAMCKPRTQLPTREEQGPSALSTCCNASVRLSEAVTRDFSNPRKDELAARFFACCSKFLAESLASSFTFAGTVGSREMCVKYFLALIVSRVRLLARVLATRPPSSRQNPHSHAGQFYRASHEGRYADWAWAPCFSD